MEALFGLAATEGAAATAGLFGAGGAMTAGGALSAAAMAAGAFGSIGAGNSAAAQQRSAAQAAEYNAQVDRNRADNAMQVANANEEAQRRHARIVMGQTRAGLAQAGIGAEGSASDVLQQSSGNAELDALNIRYQGQLQAQGLTNQANLDDYTARTARSNASSARTGGWLNAGASLLSSAGTAYGRNATLQAASKGYS